MASASQLPFMSVEEYLSTTFRPDVDYVDGYIEERNLGEMDHGILQFQLAKYFDLHRHDWKIRFTLETRTQTSARRFRVPDLCVLDAALPKEQIIRRAPLLCIEILSPEDRLPRMLERIQDYFVMGVPCVWIVDPRRRSVTVCQPDGTTVEMLTGFATVPGTPIAVELGPIFSSLDED